MEYRDGDSEGKSKPKVLRAMSHLLVCWLVLLVLPLLGQDIASVQKKLNQEDKDPAGMKFAMKPYPSLRFGKVLRMDIRAKLQSDLQTFSPQIEADDDVFDLRRARVAVRGTILKHFQYEAEAELTDRQPSRDVYVNFRYFRDFQIQAGKFKLPFGMDRLTGPSDLDFVLRSRIGDQLSPGRDVGIMAHGRFFKRSLNYQAGVFRRDGENGATAERTVAGRLTGKPLRLLPVPDELKSVELGVAVASSKLPEGRNGLRGRTISGDTLFQRVYVRGQRLRLGIEANWSPGPFSIKGEFIHAEDERLGQGVRAQDLPSLMARGWYLSGTWVVTGEKKAKGIEPRKNFLHHGGIGAVELAARYEQMRFGSKEHPGPPVIHPRAPNIQGNSDRIWTFGINWYLNRFAKIQANVMRERIEDVERSSIPGREQLWGRFLRLQFVL
jgi:phosphate-selective porin OprO/OprP